MASIGLLVSVRENGGEPSRLCRYFWDTVPLVRDAKRIEDVDTTGPDHGADAIRYGCLRQEWATELKLHLAAVT